jgi:hypothetical protein
MKELSPETGLRRGNRRFQQSSIPDTRRSAKPHELLFV